MHALRAHRIHTLPQIAAHKLGIYTTANARMRRSIVKDQKRPREFAAMRYFDAREAIIDHLLDGGEDLRDIFIVIEYLASGFLGSNWSSQNAALCIEALSSFLKHPRNKERLKGLTLSRGPEEAPPIQLGGVRIDIEPSILIHGENRNGKPIVGALKLHFSKTRPLDMESGHNVAALLHRYVSEHVVRAGESPEPRLCMIWDIFTGQLFTAPRAHLRRLTLMEACCEEIAFRWRTL